MWEIMEKISKIAWYFQWMRGNERRQSDNDNDDDEKAQIASTKNCRMSTRRVDTSMKIFTIIESILLWENYVSSMSVVVIFNILFWSIVILEIRSFAAASSAALVVVLGYNTLETKAEKAYSTSNSSLLSARTEQINTIINKVKSGFESLKHLRKNQPGTFCTGVCVFSIALWLIGRAVNVVLFTYALCMSILLGPALLSKIPKKVFPMKEWDSGIDEFLPTVTKDNLEVLKRAGETGDPSPTPPSGSSDNQIDLFNDDELIGLKMPSHEDGSTDGLELSELELSYGETDGNDLKIQSGHFEGSSSSEEEIELQLKSKDISSQSDDSESDFEIIDGHEISDRPYGIRF